ncbi:MAG: Trypsin-like peptidase domain [Aliidongia sp.]|nr:Trypsin-like peptidase domain [Aliidongia sp.]
MRLSRLTIFVLGLALAGCDTGTKLPPLPPASPVSFTMPTGKIAVAPLVSQLDPNRVIGTYNRNVDCWVFVRPTVPRDLPNMMQLTSAVQSALKQSKLTVLPGTPADAAGADYLLTGTIPQAHADLCIDNIWNEGPADIDAQVTVAWQLVSVKDKQVLYQTSTTGAARASDPGQRLDAGVVAAVDEATRQLLQTATFQQYLTFGHVVAPTPAAIAGGVVPPGGQGPIPAPPGAVVRPAAMLGAVLVPVKPQRPDSAALDRIAARAAIVPVAVPGGRPGSGIVIGDGYVLTTASTVGDAVAAVVMVSPGKAAEARLVRKDAELDVALLKTDETLPPALPLHPRRVAVGDKIFGVGHGGVVAGTIAAIRSSGGHDRVALEGAEPGGPVLDASGNVIGLLQADGNYLSIGSVFRALNLGAQLTDE